jgi:hypothetical protein
MKNQIIVRLLNGAVFMTLMAALTQTASALPLPSSTPDASSTANLMGVAFAGLVAIRRFSR